MADDPSEARRRVVTPVTYRARKTPLASLPADLKGYPAPSPAGCFPECWTTELGVVAANRDTCNATVTRCNFSAIFGNFLGVCSVHLERRCVFSYSEMTEMCVES